MKFGKTSFIGFIIIVAIIWTFNMTSNLENFDPKIMDQLKNTKGSSVPLPEGQLNFFYNNKFDPSCCNIPHIYTTSTGCACLSLDQFNYLNQRGGNNTVFSNDGIN